MIWRHTEVRNAKAAKLRPKDEADFTLFAPLLDDAATVWLRTLISRLYPGHPWLARLAR